MTPALHQPRLAPRVVGLGVSRSRAKGLIRAVTVVFAFTLVVPLLSPDTYKADPPKDRPTRTQAATLRGRVVLGPRLTSRRARFSLYPDVARPVAKLLSDPRSEEIRNVVVYLETAPPIAGPHPPGSGLVVRQENETFIPHVLPVVKGSTVEFLNADPLFHNVFSLSGPATFDLGRYPRDSSKSVHLEHTGVVKVFCHIHSDMSAVILVLDNPYFARPDAEGRYVLEGVPPGEYSAVAWHERARPLKRTFVLEAGRTTVMDFAIPLTEPEGDG